MPRQECGRLQSEAAKLGKEVTLALALAEGAVLCFTVIRLSSVSEFTGESKTRGLRRRWRGRKGCIIEVVLAAPARDLVSRSLVLPSWATWPIELPGTETILEEKVAFLPSLVTASPTPRRAGPRCPGPSRTGVPCQARRAAAGPSRGGVWHRLDAISHSIRQLPSDLGRGRGL